MQSGIEGLDTDTFAQGTNRTDRAYAAMQLPVLSDRDKRGCARLKPWMHGNDERCPEEHFGDCSAGK